MSFFSVVLTIRHCHRRHRPLLLRLNRIKNQILLIGTKE